MILYEEYIRAENAADFDGLASLLDENFQAEMNGAQLPGRGPQVEIGMVRPVRAALPDYVVEVKQVIAQDDLIAAELGRIQLIARDHDAAIRSLERSLELGEDPISANNLSLASHLSGNDDKALRLVLGRSAPQGHAALQRAYDEGGWEGMVRVIYYADVAQSAIACTAIPGFGAHVYALLGEKEKMYACIDEALAEPSVFGMYFKGYPTWDPYRDEPRFQAILRRLGLAD